jgi:hypothetical protein
MPKYGTENLTVSLTIAFADYLRSNGYDVYWHATQTTDANTAGLSTPKATVTLVPEFPANPSPIVRLRDESAGPEQIVVPAFSLQVLGSPKRITILGLGHKEYEWEREIRVDGLAANDYQHRAFQDLLHDWLQSEEYKALPVSDYRDDPANPTPLEPVQVTFAVADRTELVNQIEAVRYYVRATAVITYVE